jgi:hypothetical protein
VRREFETSGWELTMSAANGPLTMFCEARQRMSPIKPIGAVTERSPVRAVSRADRPDTQSTTT